MRNGCLTRSAGCQRTNTLPHIPRLWNSGEQLRTMDIWLYTAIMLPNWWSQYQFYGGFHGYCLASLSVCSVRVKAVAWYSGKAVLVGVARFLGGENGLVKNPSGAEQNLWWDRVEGMSPKMEKSAAVFLEAALREWGTRTTSKQVRIPLHAGLLRRLERSKTILTAFIPEILLTFAGVVWLDHFSNHPVIKMYFGVFWNQVN